MMAGRRAPTVGVMAVASLFLVTTLAHASDLDTRRSSPTRSARPGRAYLHLLPDSEIWFLGPAEGQVLAIDGTLALVQIPGRNRPAYRISEARLIVHDRFGNVLGTEKGTGMFWPDLPGGLQRMTLDFGDHHYDSDYAWSSPSRNLQITLSDARLFFPTILYLHLSPAPTESPAGSP
jgi:hypothetical protein